MIYEVNHVTHVDYDAQVRLARFNLRLQPVAWPGQTISDFSLTVDPAPSGLFARAAAAYPATITRVVMDEPLYELTISSRFTVRVEDAMLDMLTEDLAIGDVAQRARELQEIDATAPCNYLYDSPLVPGSAEIGRWASDLLRRDAPIVENALALAQRIKEQFAYDVDATEADTPVASAFTMRRGVCQDFTHVLIAALRWAGLPAAYASGYLRTLPPPGQPRMVGVDAMHAWAMLWCGPQRGWVGLDPTNGCIAGSDHIFVALGRDYGDVAPIDGIFIGEGAQHLRTSVDVVPLAE
jgi:transglutaminase-like putative cysteine protease